jgi:hypothetical protein
MTKKQQRVPGMRAPNRAERRGQAQAADEPISRDEPMPEEPDTGRRRRKKTAENWNQ